MRPTFLRDKLSSEINLAFESVEGFTAIELKSGATVASDWVKLILVVAAADVGHDVGAAECCVWGRESFERAGIRCGPGYITPRLL